MIILFPGFVTLNLSDGVNQTMCSVSKKLNFLVLFLFQSIQYSDHGKLMIAINDFIVHNTQYHKSEVEFINLRNGCAILNQNHTNFVITEKEIVSSMTKMLLFFNLYNKKYIF